MKKILALATILFLSGAALAQQSGSTGNQPSGQQGGPPDGPGGRFAPDPAMRAKMEKYRPVLDLVQSIRNLGDVDKETKLAFTKSQAKTLLPILKDLAARADLKPSDATKILSNIEDKILTPAQLKWLDEQQLKRDEERRKRMAEAQKSGTGQVRLPGFGGGNNANRQGGSGGMFQAIQDGKPFNPFKAVAGQADPRSAATSLKTLLDLITKRAA